MLLYKHDAILKRARATRRKQEFCEWLRMEGKFYAIAIGMVLITVIAISYIYINL